MCWGNGGDTLSHRVGKQGLGMLLAHDTSWTSSAPPGFLQSPACRTLAQPLGCVPPALTRGFAHAGLLQYDSEGEAARRCCLASTAFPAMAMHLMPQAPCAMAACRRRRWHLTPGATQSSGVTSTRQRCRSRGCRVEHRSTQGKFAIGHTRTGKCVWSDGRRPWSRLVLRGCGAQVQLMFGRALRACRILLGGPIEEDSV